jgi:hypothetical protein
MWPGLKLDSLGLANVGAGKTLKGKSIATLWASGERIKVRNYNHNDLKITFGLWFHALRQRSVRTLYTDEATASQFAIEVEITKEDIAELTGERQQLSFGAWMQSVEAGIQIIDKPWELHGLDAEERYEPEFEAQYRSFFCSTCDLTYLFSARIQPGFADYEEVSCTRCKVVLGEIRADFGYELVAQRTGNFGGMATSGFIPGPFQDIVIARMKATQRTWVRSSMKMGQTAIQEVSVSMCSLCRAVNPVALFASPANGAPLCGLCFTSGRWQILLK